MQYVYVCTGAHEGQRLEKAAKTIIFLLLLTKAFIHILSGMKLFTYNIQYRHPSLLLLGKKKLINSPAGLLV